MLCYNFLLGKLLIAVYIFAKMIGGRYAASKGKEASSKQTREKMPGLWQNSSGEHYLL